MSLGMTTSKTNRLTRTIVLAAIAMSPLMACATDTESDEDTNDNQSELTFEDCEIGVSRWCDQNDDPDVAGMQFCVETELGYTAWNRCEPMHDTSVGSTPLVLSFDGAPVQYSHHMAGSFDLSGHGLSVATDWPSASTPWLALDRDDSGAIEGGAELFGSATQLSVGELASNGFQALAELDDNGDGRITESDSSFAKLLVWADADANRSSHGSELSSLSQHRIVSIDLAYRIERSCDARGNCEVEVAQFRYVDENGNMRTGRIVDVHLAHR
jgi:hypothetical protein